MFAALLITLREGIEAALVVGIILGVLAKTDARQHARIVWGGVGAAAVVSLLVAWVLRAMGLAFEGRGEQLFEGIAMLLAAGMLIWMILWMQGHGRQLDQDLRRDSRSFVQQNRPWLLFGLAFTAVVREGIETVLFLTATAMGQDAAAALVGAGLGLLLAIALAWLLFAGGSQLDLQAFFKWTGLLLLFVAAGLLAHGVHELQEAAVLPTLIEHVWDVNTLVDENGLFGSLLKALFGYNGNPSLLEVIVYVGSLTALAWPRRTHLKHPGAAAQTSV